MTDRLLNAMRMHAGAMDALTGQPRWAVVTSFDPVKYTAKVQYGPNDAPSDTPVISGWLPVVSAMVGPNWGMVTPLQAGQQVFVVPDGGNHDHGVILGGTWSMSSQAPQPGGSSATSGEWAVQGATGTYIRLFEDGRASIKTPDGALVTLNGGTVTLQDPSGTSLALTNNGSIAVTGVLAVVGQIKVNGTVVIVP